MKACPVCGRMYPADAGFCPTDGSQLVSATQAPVASDDQDPRIGQMLFQRYQVRRVVADGGMGRVYEALDMQSRRNVAVKVLHQDVVRDEVSVERFKREFEVSALLPHDHIVEVMDFQPTADGSFALMMEFLYGEELRATLKREGVLPPARIVRMLSQVAIGMDEAHGRKLVHRDLKPDNIFLCQTNAGDVVKILDFGSVKDKTDNAKKLTVMGTTIGSPYYMAPEQAQGLDTLDQRADVWALAAILYECVTGQVPFKGNNGPSILLEILTKEPLPPSQGGAGKKYPVPPTLDVVMAKALKKQASMRTASVGALADAVGHAYGLEGGHLDWAKRDQAELDATIAARMPQLMATQLAPADGMADDFFGDSDSLGLMDEAMAQAGPAPAAAGQFSGPGHAPLGYAPSHGGQPSYGAVGSPQGYDDVPMGLPKSNSWVVAVAVGAVALVLGVVLVMVLAG